MSNNTNSYSESLTISLRLHVGLYHDKDMPSGNKPCADQNCVGARYYADHPDDWDDLTPEQIMAWIWNKK